MSFISSSYSLDFDQFMLVDPSDLVEWWLSKKLPHPGCPLSFQMVTDLVWACHYTNEDYRPNRIAAIKRLIGNVLIDTEGFYFKQKDIYLLVPLDDSDIWTDFQLLAIILDGSLKPSPQQTLKFD